MTLALARERPLTPSLKRNNMTELFEDNQRDLERAVENLSHILESNIAEQDIAKIRFEITNQAAYVQKRHDILLDDTLRGYLEVRCLSRPLFVGEASADGYSIAGVSPLMFKPRRDQPTNHPLLCPPLPLCRHSAHL